MDNPFEWKDMEETFKCDRCGETFKLKDYTILWRQGFTGACGSS